jgi:hypothetical protein
MSYVIKTYARDKNLYFYKRVRKPYKQEETPAFCEKIKDAQVFADKLEAVKMIIILRALCPGLDFDLEKTKSLRGPDGYIPLKNTVPAMLSRDFRKRIWAEYEQLNTRRHALKEYRAHLDKDKADPAELVVVDEQLEHMHEYMIDLLTRCEFAGVDLDEVEKEVNEE